MVNNKSRKRVFKCTKKINKSSNEKEDFHGQKKIPNSLFPLI